ncbi:MAG: hypothetical protein HY670_05755 [Chloroflexi bacterium]|nr:hypothetical protein [Chloroflexota bacterium]
MCHLILAMPVLGVPLFWLLPLSYALPINLVILLLAVLLYWVVMKAMKQPVKDGFRSLVGHKVEVVSRLAPHEPAQYLVRGRGELWSAYTSDIFQPGENARVVGVQGVGVVIKRAES